MRMIKPKRCFVYVLAILALVLGAAVAQESTVTANPGVIYVDVGATGLNDGTSWANAFNYLQDGLSAAGAGDEVWVAEGVYRPDEDTANPGGTGNRTATFQLIDGVALYGGFAGVETNLNERDWQTNLTILSGDLDGDDGPGPFENNGENGYHVVYASWYTTATLDGFVVSGGNADNPSPDSSGAGLHSEGSSLTLTGCTFSGNYAANGGGMYNYASSPTLTDCTFDDNYASQDGAAMFNSGSSPTLAECTFGSNGAGGDGGGICNYNSSPDLVNCTFSDNDAQYGGGMCNVSSSPTLTECTFSGNEANYGGGMCNYSSSDAIVVGCSFTGNEAERGGAIHNVFYSSATLINCTFSGNQAFSDGGGVYTGTEDAGLTVTNCVLWENSDNGGTDESAQIHAGTDAPSPMVNYSCVQGWTTALGGMGNTGDDPLLVDADGEDNIAGTLDDDLHLSAGSPCTDTGDNGAVPAFVTTDLDGNPRIVDGDGNGTAIVDMGAYEFQFQLQPGTEVDIRADVTVVQAGNDVTLTITETNTGNVDLTDPYVELTGYGSTGEVVFGPGTYDETHISWASDLNNNAALEPGETWTWTVVVTMSETTAFTATGHGTAPDGTDITYPAYPNERDDVTVTVAEADEPDTLVAISASAEVVQAGDDVNLTITETNTGNVELTDPYVELAGYDSTGAVVFGPGTYDETHTSWASDLNNNAALEQGETWTWTVVVTMSETTALTATGHGTAPDGTDITHPAYPNERDEVTVSVEEADEPDSLVDIRASAEVVQAGDDVTLTITETNTGNVDLTDPYVELTGYDSTGEAVFGPGNYDEADASWASDLNNNAALEQGETWTWTVVVTMGETTAFTATGHGTAPDGTDITYPTYPNERDEVTVTVAEADEPDTLADIQADAMVVQAGDDVTLTITETNTGSVDVTDTYVELAGYDTTGAVVFGPYAYNETHTSWASDLNNNAALEQGETWTWTVVVTVRETTTFTATGHGTHPDTGEDVAYPPYESQVDEVIITVGETDEPDNSTPDGGNEDSGMPNPGEPAGTHTAGTSDSTGSWLWIPLVAAAAAIAAIVLPVVIMGPRRRSQD